MNRSATAVYHRINKPQWSHAVILVVITLEFMALPILDTAENWMRTGHIGQIRLLHSLDDVVELLGEPAEKTNPDGFPSFWLYDDFELGFNTNGILLSIQAYLLYDSQEKIKFDWQGITKSMLFTDCLKWLERMRLDLHKQNFDYGAIIDVENNVQMFFEVPGSKKITDANRKMLALTTVYSPPTKLGERVVYT